MMQSFEEIKRMADMARTMRERGLAKDSVDAMQQAQMATSSDPAIMQKRQEQLVQERIAMLERKHEQSQHRIEELQASLDAANKRLADALTLLTNVNTKLRDLEQAQFAAIPPISQQSASEQQYAQQAYQQSYQQTQTCPQWQAPQQAYPQQQAQQAWNQPYPPQMRAAEKSPETKPIDRNGVSPADVSVEKFFYFGNKR